jgi:thioredoxin-dependent peroxiredoxin
MGRPATCRNANRASGLRKSAEKEIPPDTRAARDRFYHSATTWPKLPNRVPQLVRFRVALYIGDRTSKPESPNRARRSPHEFSARPTIDTTHDSRRGAYMALAINDTAPDFEANTTEGKIRFHDWIGDSWVVLFSHPKDFTPICTTELGYMAKIKPEFDKRGVKIIGLSVDPVENHAKWAADIKETQGHAPNYPMIGDTDLSISKAWGMLPAAASGDVSKRTANDNATVRNVFVIGPDKKIKLILVYPMSTGRNFDEVLRVIDSLQLTAKHKVSTPVNWKPGEDVVISGSVSDDDAKKQYPSGWKSPKPYIRIVPQPK